MDENLEYFFFLWHMLEFFFKIWASLASFSFIFSLLKQAIQLLNQINVN